MALTAAQKKKIRERIADRIRHRGYRKGRISVRTGKKITDITLAKKKPPTWKKVGDKWEKTTYNEDGSVKATVTRTQTQYQTSQDAKEFHKKHITAVREKGHHKKFKKQGVQEGRRVERAQTETGTTSRKIDASLKGKFTSLDHVTKWARAKKKQLASLKRSGNLSASDYKVKLEKVQKRIKHGKKKYG